MRRKYDSMARQAAFTGGTAAEFEQWRQKTRTLLKELLGFSKMEVCPPRPVYLDCTLPGQGIRREHWRIQVEPDIWLTLYLLVPPGAGPETPVFLCPPGHHGGGKESVAGVTQDPLVAQAIRRYRYDYGWQLAKLGYAAVCPDCRGFGERREDPAGDPLNGDCRLLAHMGEPLGVPVAGMFTWDLMRLVDWLAAQRRFDTTRLGCLGFSGGGMQTLWLAALDDRVRLAVISGYLYGVRDSLLTMNGNCACNYVPHLWEYLDMGDIASLIAPRPLWVQTCRADRLNGSRGAANALEQAAIARRAYELLGKPDAMLHELCEGPHCWHGEHLSQNLRLLCKPEREEPS